MTTTIERRSNNQKLRQAAILICNDDDLKAIQRWCLDHGKVLRMTATRFYSDDEICKYCVAHHDSMWDFGSGIGIQVNPKFTVADVLDRMNVTSVIFTIGGFLYQL